MAYNYGAPPGAYNARQSSYGAPGGGPPGGFGAPPGMDAAPGMAAQSPAAMQPGFQPPPGINFNAPVIRLGMEGGRQSDRAGGDRGPRDSGRGGHGESMGGRSRPGLGADPGNFRSIERERQQVRESMMALQPPTREEVARTIFIGGLGEGVPNDDMLEDILRCPGKLRRWTRARDADDKKCKFGFAEYEDVESLEAAAEILRDVEVPLFNKDGTVKRVKTENTIKTENAIKTEDKIKTEEDEDEDKPEDGIKTEDDAEMVNGVQQHQQSKPAEVVKSRLLVVVDEQSMEYIHQWKGRKNENENDRQFRIDSCKEALQQTLAGLINQGAYAMNGVNGDADGDIKMGDANGEQGDGAELVTIPLSLEDELADIPAEQRATVAEEIKAFRDRSNRRDIERLRREEELEQEERRRSGAPARVNRLASPPPSTSNGIPVGPRGQQGVQGAPSGPKGYRGVQMPSDYVNGVTFVPGSGGPVSLNREDDDAEESDEELERRRKEKSDAELDQKYQEAVKRWQNRERQRGAAVERERKREDDEKRQLEKAREDMMIKLANWNDDEEAEKAKHPYYRDRTAWSRMREFDREKERQEDDMDRRAEEREKAEERRRTNEARGMADDFLGQMGMEAEAKAGEQAADKSGFGGFKISLGNAAAKTKQAPAPVSKRAMADVEGLLEDEEDAAAAGMKRPELKPLEDTSTLPTSGQDLTEDEKASARQQLASEIPADSEALFAHPVKWDSISTTLLDTQIRPFVEKKLIEYLGVQEEMIVDSVLDGVKAHSPPKDIAEELRELLEDEAEVLVRKVWRLLIFWGECESRGLM